MTTTTKTRSAKSEQKRQADRERLAAAVEALYTTDGWRQWLKTRRAFRMYSFNNQLLIACQAPDATRVAGFKTWQSLGGQVRRGSKSIRILAPRTFKTEVEQEDGSTKSERRMYFVSVPVFDIADVDIELPTITQLVTGDSHRAHLDALVAYAQDELNCIVAFEPIAGSASGRANMETRLITVDSTLDVNAQLSVLVHEVSHIAGNVNYSDYSREDAEVIVEATAWMVCGALGLDTSDSSIGYIAGWASRQDLDALKKYARLIDGLARDIEGAVLTASSVEHAVAA